MDTSFVTHDLTTIVDYVSSTPFWAFAESNRWQDGAIVANNPTIIAMREAQLIWPDTQIDCLVSIGCGNVPTKVRLLHSTFTFMG